MAQQSKNYRAANPEKVKAYNDDFRKSNPEKVKAHNLRFRQNNPDYAKNYHAKNQESENLRSRTRYWNDPIKEALRKKIARQTNPEKFRERNRIYAKNNQDKLNEKSQRRRAYKANVKTYKISKKEIWHFYNSQCFYCQKPSSTIDHVIPLSRGGNHGIGNLVPCCGSCNFSKAGRTVMEWRIWKMRLSGSPL